MPGTEFNALWGGSTLATWRRRGIYRALVARRAQVAVERGVKYLLVDASDDGSPILQRLGMHQVATTTPGSGPPAADPRRPPRGGARPLARVRGCLFPG